jgi:hypothetical protein
MPQCSTDESLKSGSLTRTIRCMATGILRVIDALDEA